MARGGASPAGSGGDKRAGGAPGRLRSGTPHPGPLPGASDRYDLPNIEDADLDQLLKQLELLYKEERERAAETRRRSDQLLTRITATFPLLVAALVYSLPRQSSEANWATLTCASLAILLLLTAFVAIRHNLGKEVHYAPLSGADLEQHGKLRAVNTKNLILEYRVAIIDGEERNDDTIDRLHFSFGLFVAGIFLGLVAGGLAIAHYLAASHPP